MGVCTTKGFPNVMLFKKIEGLFIESDSGSSSMRIFILGLIINLENMQMPTAPWSG